MSLETTIFTHSGITSNFIKIAEFMHYRYTDYLIAGLKGDSKISEIVDGWKEAEKIYENVGSADNFVSEISKILGGEHETVSNNDTISNEVTTKHVGEHFFDGDDGSLAENESIQNSSLLDEILNVKSEKMSFLSDDEDKNQSFGKRTSKSMDSIHNYDSKKLKMSEYTENRQKTPPLPEFETGAKTLLMCPTLPTLSSETSCSKLQFDIFSTENLKLLTEKTDESLHETDSKISVIEKDTVISNNIEELDDFTKLKMKNAKNAMVELRWDPKRGKYGGYRKFCLRCFRGLQACKGSTWCLFRDGCSSDMTYSTVYCKQCSVDVVEGEMHCNCVIISNNSEELDAFTKLKMKNAKNAMIELRWDPNRGKNGAYRKFCLRCLRGLQACKGSTWCLFRDGCSSDMTYSTVYCKQCSVDVVEGEMQCDCIRLRKIEKRTAK